MPWRLKGLSFLNSTQFVKELFFNKKISRGGHQNESAQLVSEINFKQNKKVKK